MHRSFPRRVQSWEQQMPRRAALKRLGAGGLLATGLSWLGLAPKPAAAQGVILCRGPFSAAIGEIAIDGTLELVIQTTTGSIGPESKEGELTLADGSIVHVVGQANGRSIGLYFRLPPQNGRLAHVVSVTGTGEQPYLQCYGTAAGIGAALIENASSVTPEAATDAGNTLGAWTFTGQRA